MLQVQVLTLHPFNLGGEFVKKMLSFTLAVVLALSLLVGSAFASSGVGSYFTPDTFISWGDTNNPYTLSVPSVAISDRNFIVYRVRDWSLSYLRVRFVIDSFDRDTVPVEGESVAGWIRYSGTWALGVNAALEPDYYSSSLFADDSYTFSKSFLHKPVYSNFDYYDADGELIISGDTSGSADDTLMDLTLNDGTVIQVPRSLQGADFVVANSGSQYRIWLFQPNQVEHGLVYEGSTDALYFTSDGFIGASSTELVFGGRVVPFPTVEQLATLPEDFKYILYYRTSTSTDAPVDDNTLIQFLAFNFSPLFSVTANGFPGKGISPTGSKFSYYLGSFYFSTGRWGSFVSSSGSSKLITTDSTSLFEAYSDFDILDREGNVIFPANLGSGSWSWSPWLTMSTALDITQYGDIVYQSFNYSTSAPEESPSPSPDPDDVPDSSNNGLFAWLKQQWVFLMGKLDELIAAVKDLTFDLDPFPNQTKPILDDFFVHIFPDRVSSDDVSGVGSVLDKMGDWFDTGYVLSDLFGVFDDDGFGSWFSDETKNALDSVGSDE